MSSPSLVQRLQANLFCHHCGSALSKGASSGTAGICTPLLFSENVKRKTSNTSPDTIAENSHTERHWYVTPPTGAASA
jgi:molybdopterin/thiamine biosynthesis adenylyltransferase